MTTTNPLRTEPTAELKLLDRDAAIRWARRMMEDAGVLVCDTETTGLGDTAEVIQLCLQTMGGKTLLFGMLRPHGEIEPAAYAVHGITGEDAARAPTYLSYLAPLREICTKATALVFYNTAFDLHRLIYTLSGRGAQSSPLGRKVVDQVQALAANNDAMSYYSQFLGDWDAGRGDYARHALPGSQHNALDDVRATRHLIQRLAASRLSIEDPALDDVIPPCPECGGTMAERVNRKSGSGFYGCVRYPACKGTRPLPESLIQRRAAGGDLFTQADSAL